jgi:hypothetical protein
MSRLSAGLLMYRIQNGEGQLAAWEQSAALLADTKEQIEIMRNSPNGAQFLDAAQEQLALWKNESRDRAGIHVFEPSLARA